MVELVVVDVDIVLNPILEEFRTPDFVYNGLNPLFPFKMYRVFILLTGLCFFISFSLNLIMLMGIWTESVMLL